MTAMTQSSDPITARLAEYAVSASNFPENVRQEALRSFFNLLGCAIGGAREPAVDIALRALMPFSGPGTARVIARAGATKGAVRGPPEPASSHTPHTAPRAQTAEGYSDVAPVNLSASSLNKMLNVVSEP